MDANQDPLSDDLNPFKIHSRREIVGLLRTLCERRQMINMLANHDGASIVTSILDIDETAGTVIIDCAQRERINERMLASDNISFETTLEQIQILFFVGGVSTCEHDGAPALLIDLPVSVIRLQRREFYRVPTPVVSPVSCTIAITQDTGVEARPVRMVLQNVSGGGIALLDENAVLDRTIGRVYRNCSIDLPGGTLVVASLEVRNAQQLRLASGKHVWRLGCLFVNLPNPMMAAIQRYISKLEREQNAKAQGRLS